MRKLDPTIPLRVRDNSEDIDRWSPDTFSLQAHRLGLAHMVGHGHMIVTRCGGWRGAARGGGASSARARSGCMVPLLPHGTSDCTLSPLRVSRLLSFLLESGSFLSMFGMRACCATAPLALSMIARSPPLTCQDNMCLRRCVAISRMDTTAASQAAADMFAVEPTNLRHTSAGIIALPFCACCSQQQDGQHQAVTGTPTCEYKSTHVIA